MMQTTVPIMIDDNFTKTKGPSLSFNPSSSLIIDVILCIVLCIFTFTFLRFSLHKKPSAVIESVPIPIIESNRSKILPRATPYYDYEAYLVNNTVKALNRTRRYYYIDLGCFDGRDIDHFVHFHFAEISHYGSLNIIAFEPDPINLSACKFSQQRYSNIQTTVYDSAVWVENGQVRYATEKGQRSKIDNSSVLYVSSIDFSQWLAENSRLDDFVYVKFTIEGAEIPILEKMVNDGTLALVDNMEIEWNDALAPDLEPRRVVLECMFDNFGMDFLYMINPVDSRHAYYVKDSFSAVPKEKGWKLKDPLVRFHYRTRKEVPDLLADRLRKKRAFGSF